MHGKKIKVNKAILDKKLNKLYTYPPDVKPMILYD
jgi:hypothetical protein